MTLRQLGGAGLICVLCGVAWAADPATQPTTQPTGDAAALLDQVDAAYAKLSSATFAGHLVGHFDVAGTKRDEDVAFTGAFTAPNRFRHEIANDTLLGSNGTTVYLNVALRPSEFRTGEAPKGRVAGDQWPAGAGNVLSAEDPSLLLALVPSAKAELALVGKAPVVATPTVIDNVACPTLRFDATDGTQTVTLAFDPQTHLLRRDVTDFSAGLTKQGATDVRAATVTINYDPAQPDAPVDATRFAWAPPLGAVLKTGADGVAPGDDGGEGAALALVGKPAIDFTLNGLDGKPVKLSDLKGKVVVLDFWATWCGPCVASLPHLDELYKAQSSRGLQVLAVNLKEESDPVAAFVKRKGWSLPVLLDGEGKVADQYKADAIPETVIIGKDGVIKKVFVGGGNEEGIAKVVEAELQK